MIPITDHPTVQMLLSFNLPTQDYAVFGSAPMFAHGIKELDTDIDLIARGAAWQQACAINPPTKTKLGPGQVVTLANGDIEVFNTWYPGEWDIDALIKSAEFVAGIPFVRLEEVIKWKTHFGREKDLKHIEMINNYLSNQNFNPKPNN